MYGYIYLMTDILTGMEYVGQHKYDKPELDPTYHGSGTIISKVYEKRPEFVKESLLEIVESEIDADKQEKYWIQKLNTLYPNGYNLTEGNEIQLQKEEIVSSKEYIVYCPKNRSCALKKYVKPENRVPRTFWDWTNSTCNPREKTEYWYVTTKDILKKVMYSLDSDYGTFIELKTSKNIDDAMYDVKNWINNLGTGKYNHDIYHVTSYNSLCIEFGLKPIIKKRNN